MKVSVVNLGCKVNRVESDTISASYLKQGAHLCDASEADLIVVNTCTVTEEADKKTRKTIRRVLRENPLAQVIVTGCASAIDPEFYESLDERITICDKHDLLDRSLHGFDDHSFSSDELSSVLRVGSDFPTRVAVKVQDGCNHACTYCIVHVARGKAWSRPSEAIVQEVVSLAQAGVKEIILSGIDLGSYAYRTAQGKCSLAGLLIQLLEELDRVGCSDVRLRVSSIEPRSVKNNFIEVLAQAQGRICRHLHLPLQSGSSKVLKEMNRPYTAQDYLDLVSKLTSAVGDISLTTDIIVGFPGERDLDFEQTCQLAKQVGFTKIHVFRYSKRKGTPAALRADQIDPSVKEQRAHELLHLSDELRRDYILAHEKRIERIVVEKQGWGMSESYYKVRVPSSLPAGSILEAPLSAIDEFGVVSV